jgi:hypothetical protein
LFYHPIKYKWRIFTAAKMDETDSLPSYTVAKLLNTLKVVEWNKAVRTQIYTAMTAHHSCPLDFDGSFISTNVLKLDVAHMP